MMLSRREALAVLRTGTVAPFLASCGFTAAGAPQSLQLVGRDLSEPTLCRIAHAYEQATDWNTRHPEV